MGVRLSQDLIVAKVEGQLRLLDRRAASVEARQTIQELLSAIQHATRLPDIRRLEGMAGRVYWRAWQGLPVRFDTRAAHKCPRHWQTCGTRVSALTNSQSPRKAVNPANAVLNYLYAILEAEARIAALAVGLDPTLGLLHADQRNRDSLAADLMEPVRPYVDAFLLELLNRRTFSKTDVHELLDGQCRLLPPLTEQLAQTAPMWARRVMPVAQEIGSRLIAWEKSTRNSPNDSTKSLGHGHQGKVRRAQRVVIREYRARVEPDQDPRRAPAAGVKRRQSMARIVAANRGWEQSAGNKLAVDHYRRVIVPALQGLKLKMIMAVTGLSKGACSKIRQGKVVPHPRHWEVLQGLVTTPIAS